MRAIVAGLAAILLWGCAATYSEVTVFHDLPEASQPLTYAIRPLQAQEGSLEHKSYEDLVKAELNKRGYKESSSGLPDIYVLLFYGVSGREVATSYPIYGQTGASSTTTRTYPSIAGLPPSTITTYNPATYGVVGIGTGTETIVMSYLFMDFVDATAFSNGKIKKRYESKVVSVNSSASMPQVMPAMIQALFEDFPGKSGSTRRVDLPAK